MPGDPWHYAAYLPAIEYNTMERRDEKKTEKEEMKMFFNGMAVSVCRHAPIFLQQHFNLHHPNQIVQSIRERATIDPHAENGLYIYMNQHTKRPSEFCSFFFWSSNKLSFV